MFYFRNCISMIFVSREVTGKNNFYNYRLSELHNPLGLDGGDRQDWGAVGNMPLENSGNAPGRLEWTDGTTSAPDRRGCKKFGT